MVNNKPNSTKKNKPQFLGGSIELPDPNLSRVNPETPKQEALSQPKDSISKKKPINRITDSGKSLKEKLPIIGPTSGKDFPSTKLSGHLKTRPDMDPKGIQPASLPHADVLYESDDYVEPVSDDGKKRGDVNLADLLKVGWKVTGRRGGKGPTPSVCHTGSSSKGKKMVESAAKTLVMLSRDSRGINLSADKKQKVEQELVSDDLFDDNDTYYCDCDFYKRSKINDVIHENNDVDKTGGQEKRLSGPLNRVDGEKEKKKRKKGKLEIAENGVIPLNDNVGVGAGDHKYRCETCNQSFRMYQALGGHMSKYHKMKISIRLGAQVELETEEHQKRGEYLSADGPLVQVAAPVGEASESC